MNRKPLQKEGGKMGVNVKIGFLGTGNMARAIIDGLMARKVFESENIYISDVNCNAVKKYANGKCLHVAQSNVEAVKNSDIILLCVKPIVLPEVLEEIKAHVENKLIISIVAGASIEAIKKVLGDKCRIVRTMPNTPAIVAEGMTVVTYDTTVNESDREITESIFKSIGKMEVLDERYLNSVIALTSSSPAYFFIMLEAMADAAVQAGLPRNTSYEMAGQVMLGSAKLFLESGKHPAELKDMVCSPGGTTIEAVAELEKCGFRDAIISAMKVCTDKANSL